MLYSNLCESQKIKNLSEDTYYLDLIKKLESIYSDLINHPVYKQLDNLESLKIFMSSHVFAVWDFMTLLKTLQYRLTCTNIPWIPSRDTYAARLINEIVLAEETDEISSQTYISHFELYLAAMAEIGADNSQIQNLVTYIQKGVVAEEAVILLSIPEKTKDFINFTLKTTKQSTHEIASVFLLGRENIIPVIFKKLLDNLPNSLAEKCPLLYFYLERHIYLDKEQHAPMAQKILNSLCRNDPVKWDQGLIAARNALKMRLFLFDGIVDSFNLKK